MNFKLVGTGLVIAAIIAISAPARAADLGRPTYKAPAYSAPAYANWSEEEKRAWNTAWYESPEGVKTMQDYWQAADYRHYSFAIRADGTFRIDDVPAGAYTLLVWTEEPPFAAKSRPKRTAVLQRDIVVPPMPGGRSDEPLQMGALQLERVSE